MGSVESREAWAKRFVESLSHRKALIQAGAPKRFGKPITDAIAAYKENASRLRPRTQKIYREATDAFAAFAAREGIDDTAELTPERLWLFRGSVAAVRKRAAKKGGDAGEHKETKAKRSPVTVNRYLRTMATILNVWRKAGIVPQLHSDDIRDRLAKFQADRDEIDFLTAAQFRDLIKKCLAHDAANVRQPRPIAPFAVALLLGAFRSGEALGLQWSNVFLDQGVIRLHPTTTKTKTGRRVTLAESPALARLLEAMKPDDASGSVFDQTGPGIQMARSRLIRKYKAPAFTWQQLRRTSVTFTWNMPEANPHKAAKRAGHSLAIAESRYADLVEVPKDARTLEAAMQIEAEIERVIVALSSVEA